MGLWCNDSTWDFDSPGLGLNPDSPAIYRHDVMVAYVTLTHGVVVQVHLAAPGAVSKLTCR